MGLGGKRSALARVTLVDFDGEVIYDQHVRPNEKITGEWLLAGVMEEGEEADAWPLPSACVRVGQILGRG